jgi:hypothetical protein
MSFRVTMMYHPSHHVPDLNEAERFFAQVFGRASTPLATMMREASPRDGYPTDYSTFTPIRDVLFDTIDPKRYVVLGAQRYPTVERGHLKAIGWYVEGMQELYDALRARGVRIVTQLDEVATGDEVPTAAGSPMPLFFSSPDDCGLRYEFFPLIPFPLDPRVTTEGWALPPVEADDPLGIVRCSHHTILTTQPGRALGLFVDLLGGTKVHGGRDDVLGLTSTYVHLGDSLLELAVPDAGTFAHDDLQGGLPHDTYHSLTWQVVSLERVERHLAACGVGILRRSDEVLVTDPATSLGVPWGFTTRSVPGDPRPLP